MRRRSSRSRSGRCARSWARRARRTSSCIAMPSPTGSAIACARSHAWAALGAIPGRTSASIDAVVTRAIAATAVTSSWRWAGASAPKSWARTSRPTSASTSSGLASSMPRVPAALALRDRRGEAERQRRAVGPADQRGGRRLVDARVGVDERAALGGAERRERQRARDVLPAVLEPLGRGALAPGDDDDRAGRKRGQQPRAQRAVEPGDPLVGVEQQQRALLGLRRGEDLLQRAGDRRQLAAVDPPRRPAALGAEALDLSQQRALADPAGAVNVHDAGRRVLDEERVEHGQLGRPADEPLRVACAEPVRHGLRHRAAG